MLGSETGHLDIGGVPDLLQPTDELLQATVILDSEFHAMHDNFLSKELKRFCKLVDRTSAKLRMSIPDNVLLCLNRTRTYIYKVTRFK